MPSLIVHCEHTHTQETVRQARVDTCLDPGNPHLWGRRQAGEGRVRVTRDNGAASALPLCRSHHDQKVVERLLFLKAVLFSELNLAVVEFRRVFS